MFAMRLRICNQARFKYPTVVSFSAIFRVTFLKKMEIGTDIRLQYFVLKPLPL
jgi:hypothetical protein